MDITRAIIRDIEEQAYVIDNVTVDLAGVIGYNAPRVEKLHRAVKQLLTASKQLDIITNQQSYTMFKQAEASAFSIMGAGLAVAALHSSKATE